MTVIVKDVEKLVARAVTSGVVVSVSTLTTEVDLCARMEEIEMVDRALLGLLSRYETILANSLCDCNASDVSRKTSRDHLVWMLRKISEMDMTDPKANRWLGFVQGVMAAKGMIDVDEERELTRHIFS